MKSTFTKKLSLVLFSTMCSLQLISQNPAFQWVNQGYAKPGGSTPQVKAGCIAIDADGNSYVTGTFVGRTVFGKGADTIAVYGYSAGSNDMGDMYLAKYDSTGKAIWVRQGLNRQRHVSPISGTGVAVDINNNIYITGIYVDSVSFGTTTLAGSTNSNNYSCSYITKYDASGNLIWAKGAGSGPVLANAVCVDASGNSYLSGIAAQATIAATSYSNTAYTSFIAKYSVNGTALWAVDPGYSNIISSGIACYGNTLFTTGHSTNAMYITKSDTAGNPTWTKLGTGAGMTTNGSVVAADNQGNCYLAGSFRSALAFGTTSLSIAPGNTSQQDGFLIKFDGSGNIQWNKSFVGTNNNSNDVNAICTDGLGNIYISGIFSYQTNFGSVTIPASAINPSGGFVAKFDAAGTNSWAMYTSTHAGLSIASNSTGTYFTGSFSHSETFGTITMANTSIWPSMFVAKLGTGTAAGIENFSFDERGILLYPNPGNGVFKIQSAGKLSKDALLEVYTITGQKVLHQQSVSEFDLSVSAKGIYFVRISDGDKNFTKKIVVE